MFFLKKLWFWKSYKKKLWKSYGFEKKYIGTRGTGIPGALIRQVRHQVRHTIILIEYDKRLKYKKCT